MPEDEDEDREIMRAVSRYLERVNAQAHAEARPMRTPLGDLLSAHLGTDAAALPVVRESVPDHRLVDADIALEALAGRGSSTGDAGALVGVSGGQQRMHNSLAELVSNPHQRFEPGPVDYAERDTGPDSSRRVVSMGIRMLTFRGRPLVVAQRAASPQTGVATALLEVMGADPEEVSAFIQEVRAEMVRRSVLRGQVLSFAPTEYGRDAGATFLARPDVRAEDVVLPEGLLDEVVQHVVGIGEHRELLRRAGQHLKRGVLLYGPPGTGKTLTIRHLIARATDATVILLTGAGIRLVGLAAEVARTFPPSIVVLEDIDLVAMERHGSPQPLLFEVLEALDGLDGDADVAFVMTTNRVEVLERALVERPGRVDLAVEVPLPGREERERLLRHYSRALPFTADAIADAAEATDGVTGSFAKELVRRAVLLAATRGEEASDAHLAAALDDLRSARQQLTRRMLGADADAGGSAPAEPAGPGGMWFASSGGF
jgi:hypothetical protein